MMMMMMVTMMMINGDGNDAGHDHNVDVDARCDGGDNDDYQDVDDNADSDSALRRGARLMLERAGRTQ